ncbi:MAG: DUF1501 domain-containing protein, partial [Phycisphaerales bacterium]
MDLHNANPWTRRSFLARGVVLASAAVTAPSFVHRSAMAMAQAAGGLSSVPGVPDERILVVVQLGGGNDGLNTVIPFQERAYYNARPGIAVPESEALRLGRNVDVALHPRLEALKAMYDDGLLSIVQGVGYPNPNRSHFMSMDIWQTGDTRGTGDGWLGRYVDNECKGRPENPAPAPVAIGAEAPLALQGRTSQPIAFESPELFRWTGEDLHDALREPYHAITHGARHDDDHPGGAEHSGGSREFLLRTAMDAQVSSEAIRRAVRAQPLVEYPRSGLARQLAMVSAMIRAEMKTRVYYVTLGGFDTHAGQGGAMGRHANLLEQLATSIKAFYADLKAHGADGRVLTMTFSEFGRRVGQNASNGTDHGAAAPLFLVGPMVRPGVRNAHPSMTNLEDGDVRHSVDFRAVYTGVLRDWMKTDPTPIIRSPQRPPSLFKTRAQRPLTPSSSSSSSSPTSSSCAMA